MTSRASSPSGSTRRADAGTARALTRPSFTAAELARELGARGASEDAWLRGVAKLLRQLGGVVEERLSTLAEQDAATRAGVHRSDLAFVEHAELRAGANALQ